MSKVTQQPIIENVCTAYEAKIVGWRDLTETEAQAEELFSNDIAPINCGDMVAVRIAGGGWGCGDPAQYGSEVFHVGGPGSRLDVGGEVSEVSLPAGVYIFLLGYLALNLLALQRLWQNRRKDQ